MLCTCIGNAELKISSNSTINHALIETSPCNNASGLLDFYDFDIKSVQNNQNLKFSSVNGKDQFYEPRRDRKGRQV